MTVMNTRRRRELHLLAKRARDDQARSRRSTADRNAYIYDILNRAEMSQAEVCRIVELTREQVRRITDAERKRRAGEPDGTTPAGEPDGTAATE